MNIILFLYDNNMELSMDATAIAAQMERNIMTLKIILDQQSKKIIELEQVANYYKRRNECLERDFEEMAAQLEKQIANQLK
jgi:hypothetical protein